jgi:hypothetical protein
MAKSKIHASDAAHDAIDRHGQAGTGKLVPCAKQGDRLRCIRIEKWSSSRVSKVNDVVRHAFLPELRDKVRFADRGV